MTEWELKQIRMIGIASDALDTARNALREINLECELIDSLIQEISHLEFPKLFSEPPPYERPTTEGLTFCPDTRDAIGYIRYPRRDSYGFSGIEAEFLAQISSTTALTLSMKRGFKFLVAFKNGRKWEFLDPIDSLAIAINHLSNHKGKLRVLIHYASNTPDI